MKKGVLAVIILILVFAFGCGGSDQYAQADVEATMLEFAPLFQTLDAQAAVLEKLAPALDAFLAEQGAEEAQTAARQSCTDASTAIAALITDFSEPNNATREMFRKAGVDTLELTQGYAYMQDDIKTSVELIESMRAYITDDEADLQLLRAIRDFLFGYTACEYQINYLAFNEVFAEYPDAQTEPFREDVLGKLSSYGNYVSAWEHDGDVCDARMEALVQQETALYTDYAEAIGAYKRAKAS